MFKISGVSPKKKGREAMLTLISGGSASGKSEYAEGLACSRAGKRCYIATMRPCGAGDSEFAARVKRHRALRAGKGFETVECPANLAGVKLEPNSTVLLECLSNLAANELYGGAGESAEEAILAGVERLCTQAAEVIVVTVEIFSDGVSYDESTKAYLRLLGRLNRRLAVQAQRVVEVVYGIPVTHKDEREETR